MFNEIYKLIEEYEVIVIARHVGVDPDAMASTMALKDSINLTFNNKKVYTVGSGTNKFSYLGKLDKIDKVENALLIVLDNPDIKRIDGANLNDFKKIIKIDHHPFVEKFADIEYIDDKASSASEIVLELINATPLLMDKSIAIKIFLGIISDTNRFLNFNVTAKTFKQVSDMINKYDLEIEKLYEPLYLRPLSEIKLEGYIAMNLILTENGTAYIKLTNDILEQYNGDAASPGNMINNFNYINEAIVWVFFTEDVKNNNIRVSVRSRGPVINEMLVKYNGGGHKYASGARLKTMDEASSLIDDLDKLCKNYVKEKAREKAGDNDENK